jgi:hypothetical protein
MVGFRVVVALDVLVNRRHPNRRHAKLEEIVEFIENAIERSSVDARVRWIGSSLVPAKEAVRHHEVNDIILGNLLVHIIVSKEQFDSFRLINVIRQPSTQIQKVKF